VGSLLLLPCSAWLITPGQAPNICRAPIAAIADVNARHSVSPTADCEDY
jgi:hypothetical protein